MNVLIVDDDRFVVASLERGVHWSALGFNKIYTAYNIASAQAIIEENTIDLLLSDIDMPQGSGLELLSWMRDRHDDTLTIFLTNYADFNYAQKAMELKTFRYFLKPIEFDKLEKIIQDATSHLRNIQTLSQKKYESFWQTFLHQDTVYTKEYLLHHLREAELPSSTADTLFLPIVVDVFPYYLTSDNTLKSYFSHNNQQLNYLTTTFHAVFSDFITSKSVFLEYHLHSTRYLAILSVPEERVSPLLLMACENYVQLVSTQTLCGINCFVGIPSLLENFQQNFSALHAMFTNKLDCKNQVLLLSEYEQPPSDFPPLDTKLLEIYLSNRQYSAFLNLGQQYLQKLTTSKRLHALSIAHFQLELVQVIHFFLKNNEIHSNKLFHGETYHLLSRIAQNSRQAMELYLQYMTHTLEAYLESTFSNKSQIESIKEYIDQHFTEEVHLHMLSEIFFMDSDYASKLFKKNYGISIKNYIISKRIEAAKGLLASTELPVNIVAINVGYENYSYFTRLFKKMTNLTPVEFRSQVSSAETKNEDHHLG